MKTAGLRISRGKCTSFWDISYLRMNLIGIFLILNFIPWVVNLCSMCQQCLSKRLEDHVLWSSNQREFFNSILRRFPFMWERMRALVPCTPPPPGEGRSVARTSLQFQPPWRHHLCWLRFCWSFTHWAKCCRFVGWLCIYLTIFMCSIRYRGW